MCNGSGKIPHFPDTETARTTQCQVCAAVAPILEERDQLTHPEHPHHPLPAGTYQTTYQVDFRTMRRVSD